jgi:transposase
VFKNWLQSERIKGHIFPGKQGGSMVSPVMKYKAQLIAIFEKRNDATLAEYCELLYDQTGLWVSQSTMCRTFQRLKLPLKKKRSAPAKLKLSEFNFSEQSIGKK